MPQLFLILEEGNTALLTRALGDIQTPRFASQGLLSTIASWCMESCGHELRVIASTNVRVVYRRFDNHLLFVLVTSNLLLQTQLLQLHLETLYDVLLLLLGSAALVLDTSAKISVLRSKLKVPDVQRAVDSLVADDTLVPCILLPVPQVVGLPMRDKAHLQGGLTKIVAALGCQHAALISGGYYTAATHGWRTLLSPREQLLVQHLATQHANHHHQADGPPPDLLLHLAKRHYEAPLRLRLLCLQEGVLLAVLFESGGPPPPPLQDQEDMLRSHLNSAAHALEFSSITFDLALLVEHSPPSAILLWGHGGGAAAVQQGFNPLVSPSLRKQIGSSPGPIVARLSYRPSSGHREESLAAGAGDGLQLFFRSTLDTLVSFALQTWSQMPPALQAALQDRRGGGGDRTGGPGGGGGIGGGGGSAAASTRSPPRSPPKPATAPAATTTVATTTTTTASSPPQPGQPHPHQPPPLSTATPPPVPTSRASGVRGTSPGSRLGLGAIRRISTSALNSSVSGAARLSALFGRNSSTSGAAPAARAGSGAPAEAAGAAAGAAAEAADEEEPSELADVPYEEVHAVIEGARLLALLDRSSSSSSSKAAGAAANPAGPAGVAAASAANGAGTLDAVDVFVAFPKRVGRLAALEAANTLRATYLMSYHDDD
ncbi:hypothetical protein PLESTM_000015800 [Pleodorina starrii]|nr:hypothetical protein PLESTM_000015800 [Pleodorina starrii]